MTIRKTKEIINNTYIWECNKGHKSTYVLGMGSKNHPYKCPLCNGMGEKSISEVLLPALQVITTRTGRQFSEEKVASIIEANLHEELIKLAENLNTTESGLPIDMGGPSPFSVEENRPKHARTRRRSSKELRQA